jgi:S-formylglutathione hydrolase
MAALLASLPASASAAGEAKSSTGAVTLKSNNVPGDVVINIYTPAGHGTAADPLPLMLLLHGGNGSSQDLLLFTATIDRAIADGRVPPLVIAMPSARRSLYMDFRDGSQRWETFIVSDLLPHLQRTLNVSASRRDTFIGGYSMGGLGCLRIAFKHPELFAAVAALEPAIEPALSWSEVDPYVKFWRGDKVIE